MKLIFYGRQASSAPATGAALLTIEQKGVFSFSTAAVAHLGLTLTSPLVLARDEETNAWYVLLQLPAGEESFTLKPRDSKRSKALVFHSQPQARAYWQAHGLNGQTSVRALVGATPVEHDGLRLYPLTPQHPTKAVAGAAPALVVPEPKAQPDVVPAVPELPYLQPEQPAVPPLVTSTPAPAVEVSVPEPPAGKPVSKFTAAQDALLFREESHLPALAKDWGMSAASLYARRSYLRSKSTPAATSSAPTDAPTLVYTPAPTDGQATARTQKTFGLQARAEELASYWFEREIHRAMPSELAEMLNLMRHVPAGKRGVEMTMVLDRAEVEQTHRLTAAGKGGNRG